MIKFNGLLLSVTFCVCQMLISVPNSALAASNISCPTETGLLVNIVGDHNNYFELVDKNNRLVYSIGKYGPMAMNGNNPIACDEVYSDAYTIGLRLGELDDLLYLYGIVQHGPIGQKIDHIRQYVYLPRDGKLEVSKLAVGQWGAKFGKHDPYVRMRLCWAPGTDGGTWMQSIGANTGTYWRQGVFHLCDKVIGDMNTTYGVVQNLAIYPAGAQPTHVASLTPKTETSQAETKYKFHSGYKVHCNSAAGNSGSLDILRGSNKSCVDARTLAQREVNGSCKTTIGSNYKFFKKVLIKTTVCPSF